MKKVLSLILALLMTASCASAIFADDAAIDEANEEAAVEEVAVVEEAVAGPYDKAIEFLNNKGIYKGKSADDLAAEDAIERYQMALFVARISTGWVDDAQWEDGPANNSTFQDIGDEPANKYLGALSYANQNGIIEGYSASKFAPYDGITYRDALTMVVRTLGYKGLAYPWGYIEKAVELGLTADVNAAYTDNLT
ncbi:MAG: S-layer homology domain-containing protein, partial [Eubacteriales bacterium]